MNHQGVRQHRPQGRPGSHRGPADQYARGMAHGALIASALFLLGLVIGIAAFLW
jgi:hypothetical protein